MADRVCWVLKDTNDGEYLGKYGVWTEDRGDAKKFRTRKAAFKELESYVDSIRVFRVGHKPDRLILTGEAARLVREWRATTPTLHRASVDSLRCNGWVTACKVLAALAGEEVRDGA